MKREKKKIDDWERENPKVKIKREKKKQSERAVLGWWVNWKQSNDANYKTQPTRRERRETSNRLETVSEEKKKNEKKRNCWIESLRRWSKIKWGDDGYGRLLRLPGL